jgi:ABC-type dipeptide/oligopeptide/nickel transport system permease component
MFSLAVAIPLGVLAATHQNSPLDYLSRVIALLGQSVPAFWLGLLLMLFFGVYLGALPVSGRGEPTGFVLPTITLGTYLLAIVMRLTRSEMLGVLREDYVRTARSKGLAERAVIYGHALKNVLIPLITVVGLQFGTLLGGAVVTETIFAWPGVGRLIMDSVLVKDYPVVQASILIVTVLLVTVNLITDLIYGYADPRVRLG